MTIRPGYLTISCYDGAGKYLLEKYLKVVKLLSELVFLQKNLVFGKCRVLLYDSGTGIPCALCVLQK